MKKIIVVAFAILVSFANWANAGEGLKLDNTYVYGGVYSKYTLGNGVVASEGAVAQGGVTFTLKSGLYADIWGSAPFSSKPANDYGKESDLTIGWKGSVGDFSTHVGFGIYNLYPTRKFNSDEVYEVFGEVSLKNPWRIGKDSSLNPFVKIAVLNSDGRNINNAVQVFAGVYNSIPLGNGWEVKQMARVGHQPEFPGGLSSGWNGRYKLGVEHTFSNKVTVGAGYQREFALGLDGGRKNENVFMLTFGFPLK